jgi:hypothetical protein
MATQATRAVRGNLPAAKLQWTIPKIAAEFGGSPDGVRKILNQAGIASDATGCYDTRGIVAALYGDLHSEKIRKERELTRKYWIENETSEAHLLDRASLMQGLSAVADAMVCRIMSSALDREAKEDLLKDLSTIPIV